MSFKKYLTHKKALIITLDDVLFPKKDYLLQVYYLFSEFMAYAEQLDAKAIINFMSHEYTENGESEIFNKTAAKFGIPVKYEHNFNLLHETARLPLKLLLFQKILELLQEITIDRKEIFVVAKGNSAEAINKIKQIEWNGLQAYVKIYFLAEYDNNVGKLMDYLMAKQQIDEKDVVLLATEEEIKGLFADLKVTRYPITEVL